MALYAREKINPVTGCIPMLLPLPVFYALNNVFNVTIEMRQRLVRLGEGPVRPRPDHALEPVRR